jgi:hypothetical protein
MLLALLMNVLWTSILRGQVVINPVVAMLHHTVAEPLGDPLESSSSLLSRLSDGTIVRRAISHVSLHLGPQKFDWLHLRAEAWRKNEKVACIVHQLFHHSAVVIRMLIQPVLNCEQRILLTGTLMDAIC